MDPNFHETMEGFRNQKKSQGHKTRDIKETSRRPKRDQHLRLIMKWLSLFDYDILIYYSYV